MKKYNEIAIIFKRKIDKDGNIEFIPFKAVDGIYDNKKKVFIDKDGSEFYHIIDNPNGFGFGYRNYINNYIDKFPFLGVQLTSKIIFNMLKKYKYQYNIEGETKAPVIMFCKNDGGDQTVLLDEDINNIYHEKYPLFSKLFLGGNEQIEEKKELHDEDINVEQIYSELTSRIIDQDKPIREILTSVWKQCSGVPSNNARSLLINGSTAVGKTEIFRYLIKKLPVPCFMTTIDYTNLNYHGKSVEGMLVELLKVANFDVDKAGRGILIIDKMEKLIEASYNSDIASELFKLLDGKTYTLNLTVGEYTIDTRKIMVICLNNPKEKRLFANKKIGFEQSQEQTTNLEKELISKFSTVVQMNELNYDSFVKILKSKNGILNFNKIFLSNKGVKLKIKNGTMKEIAECALNKNHGARSLDEIVETALSVASFEIATNPNKYSELIITPETIKDNKNYTLVKKREL